MKHMMQTLIGPITLTANDNGLQSLYWVKGPVADLKQNDAATKHIAVAVKQLEEYFAGKRDTFDLAKDIDGTQFQKKVWAELEKIPFGKTVSYSHIAQLLKNDKAVRAVGTANGRNPLSIIVPCHRVIQANGTLGGYSGGLDVKAKLLEFEKHARGQAEFATY